MYLFGRLRCLCLILEQKDVQLISGYCGWMLIGIWAPGRAPSLIRHFIHGSDVFFSHLLESFEQDMEKQ